MIALTICDLPGMPNVPIDRPIGTILRELREKAALTRREVARRMVLAEAQSLDNLERDLANTERYLERWERGPTEPSLDKLAKILAALGYALEILQKTEDSEKE